MLVFAIIMIFILIVIFILPRYNKGKPYQHTSSNTKYQHNDNAATLLALTFHPKTETVNLFGQSISNSFFYTCELTSYIPFAVNIHSKPDFSSTSPEKLGFSPNYNELDAAQQGFYIAWLAKEKPALKEMNEDMGYVYLYYYGLEYRALVEKQNQKDILFEVIALVTKFKKLRYGYDFIVYLTLAINTFSLEETKILTQFYLENKQKYSNNSAYNTVLKNLLPHSQFKKEFSPAQLFYDKEQEKLTARKNELLEYYFSKMLEKLPDTEMYTTKKQVYKYYMAMKSGTFIDTFYPACNEVSYDALLPTPKAKQLYTHALHNIKEEIKQSIKNFENSSAPLTEMEKFLFLPETLKKEISPPPLFNFKENTIISIENIAAILGIPLEETITLRQSKFIAETCEALGYEIEPSAVLTQKAYKKEEIVILYEQEFIKKTSSEHYQMACLFADLGYQIALEDNALSQTENSCIENFIKKEFSLSQAEYYRLQMRGKLIAQTQKITTDGTIKKLIKTANSSVKETVVRFLLVIACKDGIIKEKEYRLLQKIAGQLTITEEQLKAIISQFIDTAQESVILEEMLSKTQNNAQSPAAAKPAEEIKLQLNKEKLAKVQINTAEIHTVLQEIFGEEQKANLQAEPQEQNAPEEKEQNQQENALQDVITILLEKENWTRNELMNIIQHKGMMLNSILDEINEWAENEYGDFLIEENENIYTINNDVAELIKQTK